MGGALSGGSIGSQRHSSRHSAAISSPSSRSSVTIASRDSSLPTQATALLFPAREPDDARVS